MQVLAHNHANRCIGTSKPKSGRWPMEWRPRARRAPGSWATTTSTTSCCTNREGTHSGGSETASVHRGAGRGCPTPAPESPIDGWSESSRHRWRLWTASRGHVRHCSASRRSATVLLRMSSSLTMGGSRRPVSVMMAWKELQIIRAATGGSAVAVLTVLLRGAGGGATQSLGAMSRARLLSLAVDTDLQTLNVCLDRLVIL
mmetsp:Transcript_21241/g.56760  ORF Transcript_21241/g.56760 Transcript_21241/m.56760 type:complete len:201 (-) Transcript_21241:1966-2568(-)